MSLSVWSKHCMCPNSKLQISAKSLHSIITNSPCLTLQSLPWPYLESSLITMSLFINPHHGHIYIESSQCFSSLIIKVIHVNLCMSSPFTMSFSVIIKVIHGNLCSHHHVLLFNSHHGHLESSPSQSIKVL